jgi:solute carrier family 45, member 1/2/4
MATLAFSCVAFAANIFLPLATSILQNSVSRFRTWKDHQHNSDTLLFFVWSCSLCLSALLMLSTFVTNNFTVAVVLMAMNGISWAVTNWIPLSLIGRLNDGQSELSDSEKDRASARRDTSAGGSLIGIHNVAISAPQILAAAISSCILWLARDLAHSDGAGWILRMGGLAYIAAAWFAFRCAKEVA